MKTALTIAGSDPCGGAGVQSDLRTFDALGVVGLSTITAITAQNSRGIESVSNVTSEAFVSQLSCILKDTKPDATKIGMLGSAVHVSTTASFVERYSLKNVVLDPVFASSGGVPLLDAAGRSLLITTLLPVCDLITPNIQEAAALTGITVDDHESMLRAGEQLLSLGAKAVLVKGGHLPGNPTDWLLRRDHLPIEYAGERISGNNTHGTGCLLSSAIAALLARGAALPAAVAQAKEIVAQGLKAPIAVGTGRGYPRAFPTVDNWVAGDRSHEERLDLFHGIYVVTDPIQQRGRSLEEVTLAALAGGAQIIQLRDKRLSTPELVACAKRLNLIVQERGKLFIVNDRVDVALASCADGVHLGPDDMHPRDARKILGPNKLVGVSTGTVAEAVAAASYASYFGVGCIFGTKTKEDAGDPIGPSRIGEIRNAVPDIPTVAIGGITEANIKAIRVAGSAAAAVVSAVVGADNIETATRRLVALFSTWGL